MLNGDDETIDFNRFDKETTKIFTVTNRTAPPPRSTRSPPLMPVLFISIIIFQHIAHGNARDGQHRRDKLSSARVQYTYIILYTRVVSLRPRVSSRGARRHGRAKQPSRRRGPTRNKSLNGFYFFVQHTVTVSKCVSSYSSTFFSNSTTESRARRIHANVRREPAAATRSTSI